MRALLSLALVGWVAKSFGVLPATDLPPVWTTSNGAVSVVANYTTKPTPGAVTNLPSMFLYLYESEWFSQTNGIYSNPQEEGPQWERVGKIIYTESDGTLAFGRDVGIQIHGCSSRDPVRTKKHSFTLKFKTAYGGPLAYPIYGDDRAASVFKTLILSAGLNITWSCNYDSQARRATYVRDQYANDLQQAMGWPSVHGRFVHLYLNDIYWGMYCIREKPDEDWAKWYFGGKSGNYDVVKNTCVSLETVAGSADAYVAMAALRDYDRIKRVLDVDAFIDYMLLNFYLGNTDWAQHNWYAFRDRTKTNSLWRYIAWDSEYTMLDVAVNVTGKMDGDPTVLHSYMKNSAEYRKRFSDRAYWMLTKGILSGPVKLHNIRTQEIEEAVVLEAARWGDSTGTVFGKTDWDKEVQWVRKTFLPNRKKYLVEQLKTGMLYPRTTTPEPAKPTLPN